MSYALTGSSGESCRAICKTSRPFLRSIDKLLFAFQNFHALQISYVSDSLNLPDTDSPLPSIIWKTWRGISYRYFWGVSQRHLAAELGALQHFKLHNSTYLILAAHTWSWGVRLSTKRLQRISPSTRGRPISSNLSNSLGSSGLKYCIEICFQSFWLECSCLLVFAAMQWTDDSTKTGCSIILASSSYWLVNAIYCVCACFSQGCRIDRLTQRQSNNSATGRLIHNKYAFLVFTSLLGQTFQFRLVAFPWEQNHITMTVDCEAASSNFTLRSRDGCLSVKHHTCHRYLTGSYPSVEKVCMYKDPTARLHES